jgi:hypothetical protein
LSLFFLRRRQDGWAGFWLAATSIKPQMVILVGLWMVLWALFQRRTRFLWGLIVGGVGLLLGSIIFLPRWPLSFLEDIQRYSEVASGRNPLDVLSEFVAPGNPAVVTAILTGILILLTLLVWLWGLGGVGRIGNSTRDLPNRATSVGRIGNSTRDLQNRVTSVDRIGDSTRDLPNRPTLVVSGSGLGGQIEDERFEWVLFWTIAVSLLVLFQTGSTNQALLFIPLFLWFWQGLKSWGRLPSILIAAVLIIGPWILFLTTISGNYENPILLLPLPFLCLIVLGLKASKLRSIHN